MPSAWAISTIATMIERLAASLAMPCTKLWSTLSSCTGRRLSPPLALFWNNQGVAKEDFKVALAVVRSIESVCALAMYAYLGLLTSESASLLPWIVPGVLIGFPLGHALLTRVRVETFRRLCMSFDAWLVAFGLSHTLAATGVAPGVAYQLLVATLIIDSHLLYRFFRPADPPPVQVTSL